MINSDINVPVPVQMQSDKFLIYDNNRISTINFADKCPKEFEINFISMKQSRMVIIFRNSLVHFRNYTSF